MYKLMVALRYMRRNWLNLVGVLAIAISVLVLLVVLSVMKGFDEEFRSRVRATLSDLIIENWTDDPFGDYEDLMARIEKLPHVVACAPRYEGLALIRLGKQRRYGEFVGIDLPREIKTTDFADYWRAWRGKMAREELTVLAGQGDVTLNASGEKVRRLLGMLRHEDWAELKPGLQSRLMGFTAVGDTGLEYFLQEGEKALPDWGDVPDPKQSPAIVGSEMLVLGQDENGAPVSLGLGSEVTVISATDVYEGRTFRRCRVNGQFRSGMYDYDARTICLPLSDVQQFMDSEGKITSICVRLDSFQNARSVRAALLGILTPDELRKGVAGIYSLGGGKAPELATILAELDELSRNEASWFAVGDYRVIRLSKSLAYDITALLSKLSGTQPADLTTGETRWGPASEFASLVLAREQQSILSAGKTPLRVSTWEDKRRPFLRAIVLERHVMGIILFFVMIVAGFLILSIVHTTVLSKTRDIGILKSIGGSVGGIMSIFLLNGFLMGVIGCALGLLGAKLITSNINEMQAAVEKSVGFSLFPKDIYYLDRIPVDQHPFWSSVVICCAAIIISLLAAAYPAWKASRMNAVEALRYE